MKRFKHFSESLVKQPNTQYGSNEGGVHVDDETGEKHYVKYYKNTQQGRMEALTGKIYDHMGIKTLSPEVRDVGGREAVATKWNPDLRVMHPDEYDHTTPEQRKQLGRIHHAAVLTKNWDVVGLHHDNLMVHKQTGEIHSVDHGGAFHFRAQGAPKDYGPDIGEYHSLVNNDQASGHVFGHVMKDPEAVRAGREAVASMDMNHVSSLFKDSGLHNHEELLRHFTERRNRILGGKNAQD